MSGGSLDYFYCTLQDHIGDFGDKELDDLVKDLAELFHDREWYLSADYGVGDWNESRDRFKAKWFTKEGRNKRIDKYLADFTEEIRKMIGISEKYCQTCTNWNPEDDRKRYGRCKYVTGCVMHKNNYCEKWMSAQHESEGNNE